MIKKYVYYITPCTIAIIPVLIVIIRGLIQTNDAGGWGRLIAMIFLPVLILLILSAWLTRKFLKNKPGWIWVTEILVLLFILSYFTVAR